MKKLSNKKIEQILSLLDNGLSTRDIASRLEISHTTVSKSRKSRRPDGIKPLSGRPQRLNPSQDRFIARSMESGRLPSARQAAHAISETINQAVSERTIRRSLNRSGLRAYVRRKKPFLSLAHRRQRLAFAKRHPHWTNDQWKQVIWSDETKINYFGSDGRPLSWKRKRSDHKGDQIRPTMKFGGGSLMFWGCFTARGFGLACRIHGNLDSELFIAILEDEFLGTLDLYKIKRQDIFFQHDNDPKHKSKKVQK